VWQWYAGTANTAMQDFEGAPIWRRASDEGVHIVEAGQTVTRPAEPLHFATFDDVLAWRRLRATSE